MSIVQGLLLMWTLLSPAASACTLQTEFISIPDYTPAGTIVLSVLVSPPDTPNVEATNADTNNVDRPLEVLANNSVMLKEQITSTGVFLVTCSGGGSKLHLIFTRIDTDNNAPVWQSWNYTESVRETQSVPYILPVKPKATDEPDKESGQQLKYSILPSEYSSYFSLHNPLQSVMNISLIRQINYESVQMVVLILQVSDYNSTGQKVFEVNTTLAINIRNEDDENPVWLNCTAGAPPGVCYVRQLPSNSTAGTLVQPPVKAVDGDLELNAAIFYTIASQSPASILSVDNVTGALSLTSNLPVPQTYTVLLFATEADNVKRVTNSELRLNIVPASYTPPVFDQPVYNESVIENSPAGLVLVVKATDQLRRGVTYELKNFLDVFSISPDNGEVKTVQPLDYESTSSYTINVTATDGTGFGFATVNVEVINENEFNPKFLQTDYTFTEVKRENGLEIGRVNATDFDGVAVTYSIVEADFRKLFAVHSTLGIVTINTIPANLVEKTYRFSVSASDGSRTSVTSIIVNFDSALVATASVTTIPLIVLGCVFAVIIVSVIVAFVLYRRHAAKSANQPTDDEGSEVPGSYAYGDLYELGSTSQQDNPVEGYNNFMFGDEGGPDVGSFNKERDQGELFVSNGFYQPNSTNDYSTLTNGSIHTMSGSSSLVGSQRTLVQGSRPRQLHAGSNLQVVQVENAVDASSDLPVGDRQGRGGPGLTVYF